MITVRNKTNYYCILGEGLFNLTGLDLLGITSITPLFLSRFGASMGLIGMLTTVQGTAQAVVPLLAGGFAVRAASSWKDGKLAEAVVRPQFSGRVEVVGEPLKVTCGGSIIPVEKTAAGFAFEEEGGKSYRLVP